MPSPWTAVLTSKATEGGTIIPVVTFTQGSTGEVIVERPRADDIDATKLAVWVKKRIASLDARDVALATLTNGAITPPADPAPDDAADTFFTKLARAKRLQQAKDLGILPAAGITALDGLKSQLTSSFTEAYTLDPRWR